MQLQPVPTGRQYCAVDSITTSLTPAAPSPASKCWISDRVVSNFRFSYSACSPHCRRITPLASSNCVRPFPSPNDIPIPCWSPGDRVRQRTGLVIALTLTGSPRDAIARTPTHCFVPRSQIQHSYGFAISSACDNLYCRHRSLPFSSPLLCGTQWEHSYAPCWHSCQHRNRSHECERCKHECLRHKGGRHRVN